jgi:hypothetical protein
MSKVKRLKISDENTSEIKFEEPQELNSIDSNKNLKTNNVSSFYNYTNLFISFVLKTTLIIIKASGLYLLWIFLHYFSAHLYIKFCVPSTFLGFLMSPLMISTPHCQGLRWIVYNAAGIINNMWILIGAWIYSLIWIFNTNNQDTTGQSL